MPSVEVVLYRCLLRTGGSLKRIRDAHKRIAPSGYACEEQLLSQCNFYTQCLDSGAAKACKSQKESSDAAVVRMAIRDQFENTSGGLDAGFQHLRDMEAYLNTVELLTDWHFYEPKLRPAGLKFCVGDILDHRLFGRAVVFGWDESCTADDDWCEQNEIHLLRHGKEQPFYNVLMSDGTTRYCSQENMQLDPDPKEVTHPDVDQLFPEGVDSFLGKRPYDSDFTEEPQEKAAEKIIRIRYLPSKELMLRYPQDTKTKGLHEYVYPVSTSCSQKASEVF